MPDLAFLLTAGLAVLLGATVQSGVGLGLGLVAAPVVVFLDPSLMPGSLLVVTALFPVLTVWSHWRHIDWRGLAWGLPARVPGAVAGAWLVAAVEPGVLGGLIGAMVLLAVAASVWGGRRAAPGPPSPGALLTAGAASGLAGTATSIGGPPIALLYQHHPPERVRATLGAFFLVGTLISLGTLTAVGELSTRQAVAGLWLLPCAVAGFALGRPLCRRVDPAHLRTALLAVVSASALALLVRALL